jgi:Na+-driven multidrug efflux pump
MPRPLAAKPAPLSRRPAAFVTGSIMRHVVVMATTGAIGLVAVFAVDLLNLFYLSRLGTKPVAAAVGFAGTIGFFQISISIGMTIGIGAVVSAAIGAGDMARARRIATHSLITMVAVAFVLGIATALARWPLLRLLHAEGETARLSAIFLAITSPSAALIAVGMGSAALLRASGAARRAMNVTLYAALAVAALDPLFIFGFHLGLVGAAISTVLSRFILAGLGLRYVLKGDLLGSPSRPACLSDLLQVGRIAGPAILTNIATPVSGAFVTHAMAQFGNAAVAGQATIDRITPVAFGVVYALTGAVGAIIAQNLGAGQPGRVRETIRSSLLFMVLAVLVAWAILAAVQDPLIRGFSATGTTAMLVALFCSWTASGFLFIGALFVANAAFNNLGRPALATVFNWGRATLGTIPFVWIGERYGPSGVLVGQAAGSVVFGVAAVVTAFAVTRRLVAASPARGPRIIPLATARGAMADYIGSKDE